MRDVDPWKTHSSEVTYDNPWIQVTEHQVTHPDGSPGIYGVVHMKNIATGVVPVDEEGFTWLVGQWRYCLNAYSWEIPEGGALDEDPLAGAKRELLEEAGLSADQWELLQTIHTSNSVTDEVAHIYLATGIRKEAEPTPEPSEQLTLKRLPLAEAVEMVMTGRITDAISVAGLLRAERVLAAKVFV
ncbi:NUDIX hydrolase [Kiritimatiellaeota bacterium B1221]|nr:NUDIX hydrolase [Kiritimatiellaeota bacterium B1221]